MEARAEIEKMFAESHGERGLCPLLEGCMSWYAMRKGAERRGERSTVRCDSVIVLDVGCREIGGGFQEFCGPDVRY